MDGSYIPLGASSSKKRRRSRPGTFSDVYGTNDEEGPPPFRQPKSGSGAGSTKKNKKSNLMVFHDEDEDDIGGFGSQYDHSIETNEMEHWEAQLAKRAGISDRISKTTKAGTSASAFASHTSTGSNAGTKYSNSRSSSSPATQRSHSQKLPTLQALRDNLQSTLESLNNQSDDISKLESRREVDLQHTQSDIADQAAKVEEAGKACEDYQKMRYELAMWVGALRDLSAKVDPIQASLTELLESHLLAAEDSLTHLQDDACHALQELHLLQEVVGRAQVPVQETEEPTLDEFGRDVGSQQKRDREKRFQERKQRRADLAKRYAAISPRDGINSEEPGVAVQRDFVLDNLWTLEPDAKQSFLLLQEALRVGLDDLDGDYSKVENLPQVFASWKKDYPKEFGNAYATLSLAEFAYVFDRVHLCQHPWLQSLWTPLTEALPPMNPDPPTDDKENTKAPSGLIPNLLATLATETAEEDYISALDRPLQKQFLPFFRRLLTASPTCLFLSKRASMVWGAGMQQILREVGPKSDLAEEIAELMSLSITKALTSISVPLSMNVESKSNDWNDRQEDAYDYSTSYQKEWIQELLVNLLESWTPGLVHTSHYPTIGKEILTFLGSTLLLLLSASASSLSTDETHQSPAAKILEPIWTALTGHHTAWLHSPDFLLASAPIRAAAQAYSLTS